MNILPWKMVTGLSVRSRPSTLMEGAVFFFSNLTTGGAIFRSSFSSIWRCSASPTLLSSVTLGFTPVWAAMRSASRRSNCISCKNFVPWQTPMVMFWPVMAMRQRSRKPLMGTPSRFISSISSRRPALVQRRHSRRGCGCGARSPRSPVRERGQQPCAQPLVQRGRTAQRENDLPLLPQHLGVLDDHTAKTGRKVRVRHKLRP